MKRLWRKTLRTLAIAATFVCIFVAVAWLEARSTRTLEGRALAVDGDSLVLNGERLRLEGVDAPELYQTCLKDGAEWPCGREAHNALRRLIAKGVICETMRLDRYDRSLARCISNGQDVAERLVTMGLAIDYGRFEAEAADAQRRRVGMWAGNFDDPQEWRRSRLVQSRVDHGIWDRLMRWLGGVQHGDER